jgi:hypothetical protein
MREGGSFVEQELRRKNQSPGRNFVPLHLCSLQIQHELPWDQNKTGSLAVIRKHKISTILWQEDIKERKILGQQFIDAA